MGISSLQTWWQYIIAPRQTTRKRRRVAVPRVECLETRAMLTAPVVVDGSGSPNEDLAFPGTVATLGSDADGNTLTYSVVSTVSHGTLTMTSAGVFSYTPSLNYNGPDSFTFKANDGTSDSNIGTFTLTVVPVDDPLTIAFPSAVVQVARTNTPVRIDPAATVGDIDTTLNYVNTQFRITIFAGNTNGDNQHSRVILRLQTSGSVVATGGSILYNGTKVGTYSGGTEGRALVVKFNSAATFDSVNAVLKQVSLQASKKAVLGTRSMQYTVKVNGETATAIRTATII